MYRSCSLHLCWPGELYTSKVPKCYVKTADTEGSLLGRAKASFTSGAVWQCRCYPSEWNYVGWGCFAKSRQGSSMSSVTLFSCLHNHEPSLKESACRKTTGQQPLPSIVFSLAQYCAMNLGNVLTWSSFPTWSHQITHRDVFWTVTARVEWYGLPWGIHRVGQVFSWARFMACLCLGRDPQASGRTTAQIFGSRRND